jgi:hypothetical protein
MSKPNMVVKVSNDEEARFIADALLDKLGADTQITPGMVSGDPHLLVTFGAVKPTEGGFRGFVQGLLWARAKLSGGGCGGCPGKAGD